MKILLIEDDAILLDILLKSLTSQHYVVDVAEDGQLGIDCAQSSNYDLILMDVGLPIIDGITLCKRLRSKGNTTPILLITAKDASSDRVRGLDAGADDYLIKPLDMGELHARMRALLRRKDTPLTPVLEIQGLRLDPNTFQVTYESKPLTLTPKEYTLLELFMRNPSRVFSRAHIVEHLWTFDEPPLEESVKAHIKGLRQKLKAAGAVDWIENVYGIGYRLNPKLKQNSDKPSRSTLQNSTQTSTATENKNPVSPILEPLEEQFKEKTQQLWQQYQGLMAERLEVLQQAAAAVESVTLSQELRQSATQAAHKLAGVLGMFDRDSGSVISRDIEKILESNDSLLPTQEHQLLKLIRELDESLNLPSGDGSAKSTVMVDSSSRVAQERDDTSCQASGDCFAYARNDNKNHPPNVQRPSASARSSQQVMQLLVVDDDPAFLAALQPMLEPWGISMTGLDNPQQFWDVLPKVAPDLLILDVEMPQIGGIELCKSVRDRPDWQALPILFLTAHSEPETIQQIFAAGADDYVTKPIVGQELLTRIVNRLERIRLLQNFSTKDPLTGLANQPHSSRKLEQLMQQAQKEKRPFCLVLLRATELRQINIKYGHAVGNQVLQQWGRLFQSAFGKGEVLGYWGNGEFVVGMVGLTKQEAGASLSEVRTPLRQQVFAAPDGSRFQALCNFAIAEYPTDGLTLQSLYQIASSASDSIQ